MNTCAPAGALHVQSSFFRFSLESSGRVRQHMFLESLSVSSDVSVCLCVCVCVRCPVSVWGIWKRRFHLGAGKDRREGRAEIPTNLGIHGMVRRLSQWRSKLKR